MDIESPKVFQCLNNQFDIKEVERLEGISIIQLLMTSKTKRTFD